MPAKKRSVKKAGRKTGKPVTGLVPQKHGGAIHQGAPTNPVAGTGRPPDAIRAAMRELGATKGLPFLEDVLDGKVAVTLIGTCSECGNESKPNAVEWMKDLLNDVKASVDQRIKALEQAWKYGLGTKDELTVVSDGVRHRLTVQVGVVHEILAEHPELAERLLDRMGEVWT